MVVLEVGLDGQGLVKGSQQAFSALNSLTGGVQHLMGGLGAVSGIASAFGTTLGKWTPILAGISAVFSGVSMAMSIFARETKNVTSEWTKLGETVTKTMAEMRAAQLLGTSQVPMLTARASAMSQAAAATYMPGAGPISVGEMSGVLGEGYGQAAITRYLASQGDYSARQYLRTGEYSEESGQTTIPEIGQMTIYRAHRDPSGLMLSVEQQRALLVNAHRDMSRRAQAQSVRETGTSGSMPQLDPSSLYDTRAWGFSPGQQSMMSHEMGGYSAGLTGQSDAARQMIAQMAKEMDELTAKAREVGGYLGDAAFDFVAGLRTGREVLGSMAMDMGRILMRQAMTQAAQWAFGATATG
jgi:hypothetical protein